ncbi:hypothetical protein JCGZ_19492 [Jatropha curcas]|uniref:Retrotransposon gag domain-containing protein n=1 Tax=Jatropha curcas TaxID=180498 RepID=A0A067L8D8_JATCU|nr:hypothetical protein JCGZ_19492 [Jatropha curcas]
MAGNTVNEMGFSPAQIRTIFAFAQERAWNQVPPTSSNQPIVEGRESPEPTSGHQASADNASPTERELIKQIAELKDKVERISVLKDKDPVINFHMNEYVLKPTSSISSKHTLFAGDDDPRSHLSEFIHAAQMNQYGKEDILPIRGRFVDQSCEYHQCKGHSTDDCFKLRHDIQDLIDSGKITIGVQYADARKPLKVSFDV